MSNHPNRSGNSPDRNPTRGEILALMKLGNLTPESAAALIPVTVPNMEKWVAKNPQGRMHPAFWRVLKMQVAVKLNPMLGGQMERGIASIDAAIIEKMDAVGNVA